MPEKILLVEGIADKSFYESFCKKHLISKGITVKISTPRDIGGTFNSKQGAINLLSILLKQLADEQIECLAMIVDADQVANGGGFVNTVGQIAAIAKEFSFPATPNQLPEGGLVFKSSDGIPDFGLWVMPNNGNEGILENWIIDVVHAGDLPLFHSAQAAVRALSNPKFKEVKRAKADVATWLAWQDKPGESIYYSIEGNLLDENAELYQGLRIWLDAIFQ